MCVHQHALVLECKVNCSKYHGDCSALRMLQSLRFLIKPTAIYMSPPQSIYINKNKQVLDAVHLPRTEPGRQASPGRFDV